MATEEKALKEEKAREEALKALEEGRVENPHFDEKLGKNEKSKTTFLGRLFDLFDKILGKSKPADGKTKAEKPSGGTICPMFDKNKFRNSSAVNKQSCFPFSFNLWKKEKEKEPGISIGIR